MKLSVRSAASALCRFIFSLSLCESERADTHDFSVFPQVRISFSKFESVHASLCLSLFLCMGKMSVTCIFSDCFGGLL